MAIQKPKMYYKVYKQAARVGGKFYGVPDQSDPIVPTITMQQIIDYKKLHNYSASQLATLVEEVLSGAAELVSIDGQSRNLSSLIKFEPVIKGTFANTEAGVTNQKILVRARMLKDIKVQIDRGSFEFVNEVDSTEPRVRSVAIENALFREWDAQLFQSGIPLIDGALTLAGDRLSPHSDWGVDECEVECHLYTGGMDLRFDARTFGIGDEAEVAGLFEQNPTVISPNTITLPRSTEFVDSYWYMDGDIPSKFSGLPAVVPGDVVEFVFTRKRADDPAQRVSSSKKYVLV